MRALTKTINAARTLRDGAALRIMGTLIREFCALATLLEQRVEHLEREAALRENRA